MATTTFPFDCIPQAARESGLSNFSYRLYAELIGAKNRRTGMCNPKQQTLAEKFGIGLRTIQRGVAELRAKGMIVPRRTLVGYAYELPTPDQWQQPADPPKMAGAVPPKMADGTRQNWRVEAGASLYEPDLLEPEGEAAVAVGEQLPLPGSAASASTVSSCKTENQTPPAPTPEPTFEERFGPWICAGCGKPHKMGEACPGDDQPEPTVREAAEAIVDELMAVHPEPGNLPKAIAEAEKILASSPEGVPATVEAIRQAHAACRLKWADYGPGRFIPMLPKWLGDGDWKHVRPERKEAKRETWIERRDRVFDEAKEASYRQYAELGAWEILREYGGDELVEEWRGKVENAA
jgi:hypothetical protein